VANLRIARRSGLVLRGGRNVRNTIWAGAGGPAVVTSALGTATALTTLSATGLALIPFTIVRTRGILYVRSDQVANGENQWVSYGHAVVSVQAQAIGITALPTPVTDESSDLWFVFESVASSFLLSSAVGIAADAGKMIQYDSKAMRKVEDGSTVVSVMETPATGVSEGVNFRFNFRQLLQLH